MNAARWQEIKTAFDSLLELEPSLRSFEVGNIGVRDPELGRALEGLLSAHFKESDDFLEVPAAAVAPLEDDPEEDSRLGTHVGPYELVRELGSGGMGEVYLARRVDAEFEQQVAIKLIRSGHDTAAVVRRFRAERQILANLDHPNIAKLLDGGRTAQGQPYFVMEYVAGLPITDYCDQHRLRIRGRIELFLQACEGVQHAHQNAIIHRDLKPANILVIEVAGKPVPKIIDFGIAKAASVSLTEQTQLTRFGHFIGTPGYMSPEQVDPNAKNIDSRTDVYSLGAILYVLLTGLQPFEMVQRQMPPLDVWLRQLREEEPPLPSRKVTADTATAKGTAAVRATTPRQLVSELRGDLDWIVTKSLERERERRYGTPRELAADLHRYLNDEPVTARPASTGYQMRKFVRRHRFATAFIGMVTVLSMVASAAALIAMKQKREAEHQTVETLKAQARLLTQAAAQRLLLIQAAAQLLKDYDIARAAGIIMEVLTNFRFVEAHTPEAISAFQNIRAADFGLAVLSGHHDIVTSAAYSPDGSRIVTSSMDKTARIWDARTGAPLLVLSGHADRIPTAAFSPDGTRVVTASHDKTARIWDASTGVEVATLSGHGDLLRFAAYSPDGSRIVTGSNDKTARVWDAATGRVLIVLSGHGGFVYSAMYSPDGKRIVTGSDDKTARIWDARTGRPLAVLSGHANLVSYAAFSPDGSHVVTSSADKTVRIWDARTGAPLFVISGSGVFNHAAYSPDGTRIVTASRDKTARVWDARTGAELEVLSGHGNFVFSAAFSPDGNRIVTASDDGTARTWDARPGAQLALFPGHHDVVSSAAYSPDSTRIVTASKDRTARIWDARTGAQLTVLSGHDDFVLYAAFSPDGTRVVTASDDDTARIWDARSGAQLAVLSGHRGYVEFAAFSHDGTRIVTASDDKTVRLWDAQSGAPRAVLHGHGDFVECAVFSPDGARVVSASDDQTIRIWDAHSGAQLLVLSGHGGYVNSVAFSSDGTYIVSASDDKTARIWDALTGAQLRVLYGHGGKVNSAVFSPDGSRIVTGSSDDTVRIWDASTGSQLAVLPGHRDVIYSAAYSPDGAHIVTASRDMTARIWDARLPALLPAQIRWYQAAEADPLPQFDRTEMGLSSDVLVRGWPSRVSKCDKGAAAPYDPDRVTPGVLSNAITDEALAACAAAMDEPGHASRTDYEMGRAQFAKGNRDAAQRQFEIALLRGYRAARIDLADLLLTGDPKLADRSRAGSLYEQAWRDGVPIAAFKLGPLYERTPGGLTGRTDAAAVPIETDAWSWYQRGADIGEPNALARFAEREEQQARLAATESIRDARLLNAFKLYAAAAAHAHDEDWPDDAWRNWRYRRATLARLLARQGMMQQVGDAYAEVLARTQR